MKNVRPFSCHYDYDCRRLWWVRDDKQLSHNLIKERTCFLAIEDLVLVRLLSGSPVRVCEDKIKKDEIVRVPSTS